MRRSAARADMNALSFGSQTASTGDVAVQNSFAIRQMNEAAQAPVSQRLVRQLARNSFQQTASNKWVDTQFDGKQKTNQVAFGSDEYFKLMKKDKEVAKMLALGQNVIFQWEKRVV